MTVATLIETTPFGCETVGHGPTRTAGDRIRQAVMNEHSKSTRDCVADRRGDRGRVELFSQWIISLRIPNGFFFPQN